MTIMTEERRQALTRRANILKDWLHRTDYSVYEGEESLINLVRVIDIIIWALQNTLTISEWQQFEVELVVAKQTLNENTETEEDKKNSLQEALTLVESTLHSYLEYISK